MLQPVRYQLEVDNVLPGASSTDFTSARYSILYYQLNFVVRFLKTNYLVTFCSQGAQWHLLNSRLEFYICFNINESCAFCT
jgi:hypothetical protein